MSALRIRMSQDWRALYGPTPEEKAAIEARIPTGCYLYVSAPTRRPTAWRARLHPDYPNSDPLWVEDVGGTVVHACFVALGRHEEVITTDAGGYVASWTAGGET